VLSVLGINTVDNDLYITWLNKLQDAIKKHQQRAVVVLCGDSDWVQQQAHTAVNKWATESVLWVSPDIKYALSPKQARTQLGEEVNVLVFDAYKNFDPDAFGAVSGTLCGGGLLLLLIPPINKWPELIHSRFLQRALPLMKNSSSVYFLKQNKPLPELIGVIGSKENSIEKEKCEEPFRSFEQQQVVNAIEKNALEKKPAPIVVSSDRGRGKSSALGLAAGQLLRQGVKKIIVTAPRLSISDPVFKHAQKNLPDEIYSKGQLSYQTSKLCFMAPDALLNEQPEADLLLVDEAAAIPLPMLERLLHIYPHVVFSSTIHGYEGTGRGFALKFNKVLDSFNSQWQHLTMETPIRWEVNDPVERWVDKLLCMDSELAEVPAIDNISLEQCQIKKLDRDELVNNEQQLSSLFSLLVYAHYRTQPSDLKYLLDEADVRIYTLQYQQQIIAAVLINEEGGFDKNLSSDIYKGTRRPSGHLLAQTLTFHAGCEQAATLKYSRVMRIAVHPQWQGYGLGSYLLNNVVKQEQQQGVDAIGTSFGSTVELLHFWQRADFELVRMGFTRDHASGTHSAVMLKPYTTDGQLIFNKVRQRFQQNLENWLAEPLSDLPESMLGLLKNEQRAKDMALSEVDWQDIHSFISSYRGYQACIGAIKQFVELHHDLLLELNSVEQKLVTARIQKGLPWVETVKASGVSGKNEALQLLRVAIGKMVKKMN